jgi:hypothetical protein
MNLKWLPVLLLSTHLQAGLRELPPDSQIWQQPGYARNLHFFDEAIVTPWTEVDGTLHTEKDWVSLYGDLNGGTLFDTNLFTLDPTTTANVWWNLTDSGFKLRFIVVNDGTDGIKLYEAIAKTTFEGNFSVNSFDMANIRTINLYGYVPGQVPDQGSTVLLLSLVLVGLFSMTRKQLVSARRALHGRYYR